VDRPTGRGLTCGAGGTNSQVTDARRGVRALRDEVAPSGSAAYASPPPADPPEVPSGGTAPARDGTVVEPRRDRPGRWRSQAPTSNASRAGSRCARSRKRGLPITRSHQCAGPDGRLPCSDPRPFPALLSPTSPVIIAQRGSHLELDVAAEKSAVQRVITRSAPCPRSRRRGFRGLRPHRRHRGGRRGRAGRGRPRRRARGSLAPRGRTRRTTGSRPTR
jgi:hypothetical protein